MGRLALSQRSALVPARFLGSATSNLNVPNSVANPSTLNVPEIPAVAPLDFSGYNTLSVFFTLSAVVGTIDVFVNTIDPESLSVVIPGNLGRAPLVSNAAANGNYATTLFLPTYYSTLSGLILPFFSNVIQFVPDAASSCTVDAIKLWLTNTGTAS